MDDPTQDKALILTSVLVDSRPVWGVHTGTPVADTFRLAHRLPSSAAPAGSLCAVAPAARPASCAASWSSTAASTAAAWTSSAAA